MFKNILQQSLTNRSKLSIYFSSSESNSFCFGSVVFCNDEYFILSSYTPYGDDDGFMLRKIDQITRIEIDSKYNKKMISLIELAGTEHTNFSVNEDDIVEYLLKNAKSHHKVLSIEIFGSDDLAIGCVYSLLYPLCEIKQINEYGEDDGNLIFNIDDISSIRFDSKDELMLEKLCSTNNQTRYDSSLTNQGTVL